MAEEKDGFCRALPAICRADASTLILGSMPSQISLQKRRYYAHSRNAFWPIVGALLGFDADVVAYGHGVCVLQHHGIALWDVLDQCYRPGSADQAISLKDSKCQDFGAFYRRFPGIKRVFFNGRMAALLYHRAQQPVLPLMAILPSTSAAHARLSVFEKQRRWQPIVADDCPLAGVDRC